MKKRIMKKVLKSFINEEKYQTRWMHRTYLTQVNRFLSKENKYKISIKRM